jgi:hypothetical protein
MTTATYTQPQSRPSVVRLRAGRLIALILLVMALVGGGGLWVLHTYGRRVQTKPVESAINPAWLKQRVSYPSDAHETAKAVTPAPDRSAEILRQLAALQKQLQEQQEAIEALKRRPTTVVNQQPAQAAKATPAKDRRPPGTMLFISHDLKEPPPARRPRSIRWHPAPRSCRARSKPR